MVLIGYWPLQEDSGNTAYDYAGSNNGSLKEPKPGSKGPLGNNAYKFNSSENDRVEIPYFSELKTVDTGLTFSAWVNTTRSSDMKALMWQKTSGDFEGWLLRVNGQEGTVTADISKDGGFDVQGATGSVPVGDGNWHHLVGTVSRENTVSLYADGDLKETNNTSISSYDGHSSDLSIGDRLDSSNPYDGRIAEVRIYNHALSPTEVRYLYNVVKEGRLTSGKKSV